MAIRDETRMLLESMSRLFEDHCTKQIADAAETGVFAQSLWDQVAETGVPLAALPEEAGGADAEWSDLFAALRVAARFSAPIPLAETMLACWAAAACGLETSDGPMTVGPVRSADTLTLERDGNGWRLSGAATRLPYACPCRAHGADRRRPGRRDGRGLRKRRRRHAHQWQKHRQ